MERLIVCEIGLPVGGAFQLDGWAIQRCESATELLALLDDEEVPSPELVVVRTRGDSLSALRLLRKLGERWPDIIRLLLSQDASARFVVEGSDLAHASLQANIPAEKLKMTVARARRVRDRLNSSVFCDLFEALGGLSPPPAQVGVLDSFIDDRADERVTQVAPSYRGAVAQLRGVLALLNSPLFGFDKHIFNINDVVPQVGFRTLRALNLRVHAELAFAEPEGWKGFPFSGLTDRALACGLLAQRMAQVHGRDRIQQLQAMAAGLFHDLGMRALVMLDPQRYLQVAERAVLLGRSLTAMEKLEYQVSHSELAASMLQRWGVSPVVVRAVLYHATPKGAGDASFSVLTALHVADSLLPDPPNRLECRLSGQLCLEYLSQIKQVGRQADWEMYSGEYARRLSRCWTGG